MLIAFKTNIQIYFLTLPAIFCTLTFMEIQSIKQRFGIIGNSPLLERDIDIARQVAATDLTVLINGESGTGKEVFPKIIHQLSARKHGPYIAVNCGAIPEGTIDSELFGHEKGSFTGAHEARKGYFEVANGGTIFLDEVADLPLSTQARLLRVLESGEFIKVGSSKVLKTNVRIVAATNVIIPDAIRNNKFREDLYYRLNTVPIKIPALRERQEDILLLFRKFTSDFAEKYSMPSLQLDNDAQKMMINYRWQGNIRQLKNITEQISIIESKRLITAVILEKYLPQNQVNELPVLFHNNQSDSEFNERELLYKVLFDMRKDITELKKIVSDIIHDDSPIKKPHNENPFLVHKIYDDLENLNNDGNNIIIQQNGNDQHNMESIQVGEEVEESLSLEKKEKDMIIRALEKYKGRRNKAAKELGISDRTLYRKIKEYNITE